MVSIKILALLAGWLFFYKILKTRKKRLPGIKATIITLFFASLLFRLGYDLYAFIDKFYFSLSKQGETLLKNSPLKIPPNQDVGYCRQFKDQYGNIITKISHKDGEQFCGEFWRFEKDKNILIPFKISTSGETIYWATPFLKIYRGRVEDPKVSK